jgi:hypothetical protein
MPVVVTIPNRPAKTRASNLSSRKLLAIAMSEPRLQSEIDAQSAIIELRTRQHYLSELEAQGLLNER